MSKKELIGKINAVLEVQTEDIELDYPISINGVDFDTIVNDEDDHYLYCDGADIDCDINTDLPTSALVRIAEELNIM